MDFPQFGARSRGVLHRVINGKLAANLRGAPAYAMAAAIPVLVVIAAATCFWPDKPAQVPRVASRSVSAIPAPLHVLANVETGGEKAIALPPKTTFAEEQQMSHGALMQRWEPLIEQASKRFGIPRDWIHAVVQVESGGRTMSGPNKPIISTAGAMGLMQLMPKTYADMRAENGLGADAYDPHDNIMAGSAYLRDLHNAYGYPKMFAAYNDGPGHLEQRLMQGRLLPLETQNYITNVASILAGGPGGARYRARFTRPDGSAVWVNGASAISVRPPFPGEYASSVQAVITMGRVRQGVRESVGAVRSVLRVRGGA